LPDVTYRLLRLKLFGEYAVQKNSYVRADFIYERTSFNEWTYNFNGVEHRVQMASPPGPTIGVNGNGEPRG